MSRECGTRELAEEELTILNKYIPSVAWKTSGIHPKSVVAWLLNLDSRLTLIEFNLKELKAIE